MLDYTKMAIKQTISDLKKADYIRNVATQIIYIFYLVYTLIVGSGYLALNIILLVLACSYFAFFLAMTSLGKTPEGKSVRKLVKNIYVWCKRLVKLFALGLTIYGICTAVEHVSPLSVVLAALMIVGWILQIIFEVLIRILTGRINFILEGLEADLDNMLKPVRAVGNFFKKVTGKEPAPQKEPTKNQLRLKEKVEAYRAEQKQKREEEKLRRETEKLVSKEQKREEKKAVRTEARLLKETEKRRRQNERDEEEREETALTEIREPFPPADGAATDNALYPIGEESFPAEEAEKDAGTENKKTGFFNSVFGKKRRK